MIEWSGCSWYKGVFLESTQSLGSVTVSRWQELAGIAIAVSERK